MSNLIPFEFESRSVRVLTDEAGELWFVAADVCDALTIGNNRDAIARLDDDEKGVGTIDTLKGPQELGIINESGLYSLILTSRKPEAKRFKKWVTSEVLPAIRKTGSYAAPTAPQPAAQLPSATQDKVAAILMIGDAISKVPGVKPGIAMSMILDCVQVNTGLVLEPARRALPAANEPICSHNATALGKALGVSAQEVNRRLSVAGLQFRNTRSEWELTEAGTRWGEAIPYTRNGHSGYQILWNPAIAARLRSVA